MATHQELCRSSEACAFCLEFDEETQTKHWVKEKLENRGRCLRIFFPTFGTRFSLWMLAEADMARPVENRTNPTTAGDRRGSIRRVLDAEGQHRKARGLPGRGHDRSRARCGGRSGSGGFQRSSFCATSRPPLVRGWRPARFLTPSWGESPLTTAKEVREASS